MQDPDFGIGAVTRLAAENDVEGATPAGAVSDEDGSSGKVIGIVLGAAAVAGAGAAFAVYAARRRNQASAAQSNNIQLTDIIDGTTPSTPQDRFVKTTGKVPAEKSLVVEQGTI